MEAYEGSALQLFMDADRATKEVMIEEALSGKGDLFEDLYFPNKYVPRDHPIMQQLRHTKWMWQLFQDREDQFKALVKTSHFVPDERLGFTDDERGKVAWDLRNTALKLNGFDLIALDDWQEYMQLIKEACLVELLSENHSRQHEPITSFEGLSQDTLQVLLFYRAEEDRIDEEEVDAYVDTPWDEDRTSSLLEIFAPMADTLWSGTRAAMLLERLEEFAIRHGSQEWMIDHLRERYAEHTIAATQDEEWEDEERAERLQEQHDDLIYSLNEAKSALRLEVWWRTIQENEPHRLVKDVLTAFVENKHTPEAIRDEAQIELDFHYGEPA